MFLWELFFSLIRSLQFWRGREIPCWRSQRGRRAQGQMVAQDEEVKAAKEPACVPIDVCKKRALVLGMFQLQPANGV